MLVGCWIELVVGLIGAGLLAGFGLIVGLIVCSPLLPDSLLLIPLLFLFFGRSDIQSQRSTISTLARGEVLLANEQLGEFK